MTKALPEPEDTPGDSKDQPRQPMRRARPPVAIPSVDRILQQLIELNGAVTIGALSAKEASLIQKNLKTVLDVQIKRSSRDTTSSNQAALTDLCHRDPRILNAIQSFLTDEQLELLMREISENGDAEV